MVAFTPENKSKQLSKSSPSFAQGGNGHMCPYYGSATAKPDHFVTTGPDSGKWAHGGPGGQMGGRPGRAQKPGATT